MWERKKLGDVAEIVGGGTPSTTKDNYWNGSINWYTPAEIGDKIFIDNSQRKITNLGLKNSSAKILPAGTMLFTSRAGIGKTAILKEEGSTNQGFQSIIPNVKLLDSYFIYSMSNILKKYGESHGAGSTFIEISGKELAKAKIFLPSLIEQKYISKIIYSIDDTIQLHERKCEELALIKKALLQKLFPKNDEVAPEVRYKNFNDAWEQRKLGEVGKTFTGLSGKTKEDFGHGDAHFVTYMNVYSNPISDPNMVENVEIDTKQQEVKKGDVFFTTSSETPEEVGMSSVWINDDPNIYLNSFCFGFRPIVNIFNPYYLAYLLRSNNIRSKMMILAQGISRYNISKNKVMKLDVAIPNIKEQEKIGAFFKQLDFLITLHHRKLEKLKQLKKFLLQNMFI
ncbi:restriction endonuclease subunit S [Ligilactobacillus salivarius]